MKKLTVSLVAMVGVCGLAHGDDYFFKNDALRTDLTVNTNYVGDVRPADMTAVGGLAHTVYVTNAVDGAQTLLANAGRATFYLGEIVSDASREFNNNVTDGTWWKFFYFGTLARFPGLVYTTEPLATTTFIPSGDTAELPQVDLSNAHKLAIKKAGAELDIGKASGRGSFYINTQDIDASTAGDIFIADPLFGPLSYLNTGYGLLSLVGDDETADVPGDPFLHLDATAPDSFTRAVSGGKNYVSKWADVRGGDRPYAYAENTQWHKPWMATDPESGLDVVDFGTSGCDYGWPVDNCEDGFRTGNYAGLSGAKPGKHAWLKLSEDCTQIREVFVVLKEAHLYNCQAMFLGNGINGNTALENQPFRRGYIGEDGSTGSRYQSAYYQSSVLFRTRTTTGDAYPQTAAVQLGDIRLDGQRVRADMAVSLCDRLHVLSVGTAWNVPADRIGDNGYGTCYLNWNDKKRQFAVGGFTLGEMLIYTNVLTSAERRRVNNYLRRKWQRGENAGRFDFAQAGVSANLTLDVPSGAVRAKRTTGAALVKTGSGTYDGGVPPETMSLDVRGGTVAFSKPFEVPAAVPTAPATGMDVWLDAEQETSMSYSNSVDQTKTYVLQWNHRENAGTNDAGYRVCAVRRAARHGYPTRVTDEAVGGRHVLDFGPYCWSDALAGESACFAINKFVPHDPAASTVDTVGQNYTTRTGFLVFRSDHKAACILGAHSNKNYFRDRNQRGYLFDKEQGHSSPFRGDYFALDGAPINCIGTPIAEGDYHVLSFRLTEPRLLNQVAGAGANQQSGALRVGEWICYDRPLSDKEFRDTESYLMDKWLGKTHPDVEKAKGEKGVTISSATFAAGTSFATDYKTTVANLESADGTFVKGGTGACTVKHPSGTVTNLSVTGGSVAINHSVEGLMAHALFRFDASDATTITTEKDPSGNDWVTEWRDKNGNGYTAKPLNTAEFVITNKPWLKTVEINGVEKRTIDLGSHIIVDKTGGAFVSTNDATGFQLVKPDGTTGWSGNMREWIVVAKDLHTGRDITSGGRIADHAPILSGSKLTWRNIDELHDYMTHPIYQSVTQPSRAYNGGECHYKCRCDGEAVAYNYRLWEAKDRTKHNFHVLSMAYVTNHVDWTFKVRQLGAETCRISNCASIGGLQLCEVMVFAEPLSDLDRTNVTAYLMKKWLSSETQVLPNRDFGTVGVKGGASLDLDLDGWPSVSVGNLICGGSLKLSRALAVNEGAEFAVAMTGPNAVEGLTVDGSVGLPQRATVKLTVADGLKGNRQFRGSYPILKATSLGDADISDWTLDYPKWIEQYVQPRLRKIGDTVFLDMPQNGIVLIVR